MSCKLCFVDDLLIIPAASGAQEFKYSYSLWNQKLPFLKRDWSHVFQVRSYEMMISYYDFKYLYNVNL